MIAAPNEVEIVVRETCGTYVATARSVKVRASCTMGAGHAARACADRVYGPGNYLLEQTGVSRRDARSVWMAVAHGDLLMEG